MTSRYPQNRVPVPSKRPEITASPGLENITSAGQRASDARIAASEKTNRRPAVLTGAGR